MNYLDLPSEVRALARVTEHHRRSVTPRIALAILFAGACAVPVVVAALWWLR